MLRVDPPGSKAEVQQGHSGTSQIVAMPAHLRVRPVCSLVTCECGYLFELNLCGCLVGLMYSVPVLFEMFSSLRRLRVLNDRMSASQY